MTLYEELTTGPLAAEIAQHIADRNDAAIFALLSKKDISVTGAVTIDVFSSWATLTKMRSAIQDHAANPASPLRDMALTLIDFFGKPRDTFIDFGNPDNIYMLNIWVVAGVLSIPQRDVLLAKATKLVSRADQLGVSIADISSALNGAS